MANTGLPGFLLAFVLAWVLYFVGVALLPAHSAYGRVSEAIMLQIDFALLTSASALAVWRLSDGINWNPASGVPADTAESGRLRLASRLGLALSVAGLLALFIDKVFIQGIDYLSGLAAARAEWTNLGAEREGISSFWSALGYLLSTCFFVSICVLVVHGDIFSAKERMISWVSSLGLLLGNSALTGGRSFLLLLGAATVAGFYLRADLGKSLPRVGGRLILAASAAVGIAGAYALYVFAARAELTDVDAHRYAVEMLEFLGAHPTPAFERLSGDSSLGLLAGLLALALAYLIHSVFTFAAILDMPPHSEHLLFGYLRELAAKLGFIDRPDLNWALVGRFTSLPGALYIDAGVGLLVAGAVTLGVLMTASVRLCQRYPSSLTALSAWVAVQTTALLSPLLLAAEVLSYPFVIAEFFLIAAVAGLAQVCTRLPWPLRLRVVSSEPG